MQPSHRFLSIAALALLSAPALASTEIYTTQASFLSHVAAGAYLENFNGLDLLPAGPVSFAGGGFSYTVSGPTDLYASGDFLSTNFPYETLTINFTSGNVTAVGGNFFAVDLGDAFHAESLTLTLSDNTSVSFAPSSALDSYRGFTSDIAITSLTVTVAAVQNQSLYAAIDNLTVAAAVPEPSQWLLLGLGLTTLVIARRRKA